MKLDRVILACNSNEDYLCFWPIVKDIWKQVIGVPVILYYVGDALPDHLKDDPDVRLWKAIRNWPTATQAQCIRLLVPALQDCSGAVLVGDIDCMPLHRDFFHDSVNAARDDQFVSYGAIMEKQKEICMMYVAASPKTWGDLFEIRTEDDAYAQLRAWAESIQSNGKKASVGWTTDQTELYRRVKAFDPDRIYIQDWKYQFPRLCRSMPYEWLEPNDFLASRLYEKYYIDFHMPPFLKFNKQILAIRNLVLEFAKESLSTPSPSP